MFLACVLHIITTHYMWCTTPCLPPSFRAGGATAAIAYVQFYSINDACMELNYNHDKDQDVGAKRTKILVERAKKKKKKKEKTGCWGGSGRYYTTTATTRLVPRTEVRRREVQAVVGAPLGEVPP